MFSLLVLLPEVSVMSRADVLLACVTRRSRCYESCLAVGMRCFESGMKFFLLVYLREAGVMNYARMFSCCMIPAEAVIMTHA